MLRFETDLDRIAVLADQHRDDNQAFGYFIDIMWDRENRADAELDALVDEIAAEVIPHIDCTACANCCSRLGIGLVPDDLPPLVIALHLSLEDFTARYVDHAAGERSGEWAVINASPCPLLDGKLCSVYPQRPQACRNYPLLTPDFRWLYDDMLRGLRTCPIIFNVVEGLKLRLGW